MASQPNRVAVVLPAHNEAGTLGSSVETLHETFSRRFGDAFEIVLVENGSTDETPAVVSDLESEYDAVSSIHLATAGRGGAIESGVRHASASTVVYVDADLSFDLSTLPDIVRDVESGYDIVAGSRWKETGVSYESRLRSILSSTYNGLLRVGFGSDIADHQCGYKAFDRDSVSRILADVDDEGWFWDAELLLQAQYRGYRVKEYPVSWTEDGDTSVDVVTDTYRIGRDMLRFWLQVTVPHRLSRK